PSKKRAAQLVQRIGKGIMKEIEEPVNHGHVPFFSPPGEDPRIHPRESLSWPSNNALGPPNSIVGSYHKANWQLEGDLGVILEALTQPDGTPMGNNGSKWRSVLVWGKVSKYRKGIEGSGESKRKET